jgi:DNA-directed RNA polymerase subunit RPC12/RpoP
MSDNSTTKCIRCGREVAGEGPALCDQCKAEGYAICANCGKRVANGTTPYCNICAEEIIGTG